MFFPSSLQGEEDRTKQLSLAVRLPTAGELFHCPGQRGVPGPAANEMGIGVEGLPWHVSADCFTQQELSTASSSLTSSDNAEAVKSLMFLQHCQELCFLPYLSRSHLFRSLLIFHETHRESPTLCRHLPPACEVITREQGR